MTKIVLSILITSTCLLSCLDNKVSNASIDVIDTHNFLTDFSAFTPDSMVHIIVEIPAGCNQKWEVDKVTGFLEWERINNDSLRIVKYLPYPANYGMVPQTWLPTEKGGDNDPLDIFLLGLSVDRGSVVPARVVGVIKMLDKGLHDDKLIAVPLTGLFSEINNLQQLTNRYPNVVEQISIWLASYKSGDKVKIQGVGNEKEAFELLKTAHKEYLKMETK